MCGAKVKWLAFIMATLWTNKTDNNWLLCMEPQCGFPCFILILKFNEIIQELLKLSWSFTAMVIENLKKFGVCL